MGDAQAHQGDGELACTSVECRALVRLAVEVRPRPAGMDWPRLESPDYLMTAVSLHPMEDALLTAFEQLLRWIGELREADPVEAYMLLGQTVHARATAICNHHPTYLCKIRKSMLEAFPPRPAGG
jgi:acetamidase/formamidase